MMTSKRLTIFEGPDGSGKTTAARTYANATGAVYWHHGPYQRVRHIGRFYAESMLPALLGITPVVMDRSWMSEAIYGAVFRNGIDRLSRAGVLMLERLAMRCETTVVECLPPWETVKENYLARQGAEMLKDTGQLARVYSGYSSSPLSGLPTVKYDYTAVDGPFTMKVETRTRPHPLAIQSAGRLGGDVLLVGERFAEVKEYDLGYQWPFGSFDGASSSWWLTTLMAHQDIPENRILWANADQPLATLIGQSRYSPKIIALGRVAEKACRDFGLELAGSCDHPQSWRRFNTGQQYPLIAQLREILK